MDGSSNKFISKIGWSFEEQQELRQIVESVGEGKWKEISQKLNKKFPDRHRTNKQCRQRYINFEQMRRNQGRPYDWGHEDLLKLLRLSYDYKAKWSLIRKQMEHWSENFLKNKFNGFLHKVLRKVQNICRHKHKNNYKTIKFNTLVRLYLFPSDIEHHKKQAVEISEEVRNKILKEAVQIEKGQGNEDLLSSIQKGIHQFASMSKAYLMNMGKRRSTPKFEMLEEFSHEDSGFHNVIQLKKPNFQFFDKSSRSNAYSGDKPNTEQELTISFDPSRYGRQKQTNKIAPIRIPCQAPCKKEC